MKIGKITLDGYRNYGNALQNYALQEILKYYSDSVETIWYTPKEYLKNYWQWGIREEIKFFGNYKDFRKNVKNGVVSWELARRTRFFSFYQNNINVRYDTKVLKDLIDEYDYFVVGSDQVWNPDNRALDTAFLSFAPMEKRISYAASIGADTIPDTKKDIYINGLSGMHSISVRETQAEKIVFECIGKHVPVLLDPVFYLGKSEWMKISHKPYWLDDEPFIFAYFLGDIPKGLYLFSEEKKLRIIKCFDKQIFNHYIISPEEWIYLICNASYVMTDSFHAVAFSIIMGTEFRVFCRNDGAAKKKMITRITYILSKFELEDRLINDDCELFSKKCVASSIEKTISEERIKSNNYLKKALDIKN